MNREEHSAVILLQMKNKTYSIYLSEHFFCIDMSGIIIPSILSRNWGLLLTIHSTQAYFAHAIAE